MRRQQTCLALHLLWVEGGKGAGLAWACSGGPEGRPDRRCRHEWQEEQRHPANFVRACCSSMHMRLHANSPYLAPTDSNRGQQCVRMLPLPAHAAARPLT